MRRYLFISIIIILSLPASLLAAAWNQPAGVGQLINNFSFYQTNVFHTPSGEGVKTTQFTKFEYNPYAEYGLNKDITIGTSLFLDRLKGNGISGTTETSTAIEAADFFARKELYDENGTVFSIQPMVEFPGTYSRSKQ